jgi:glycosyltransferase involved in cell wall biosynthesis
MGIGATMSEIFYNKNTRNISRIAFISSQAFSLYNFRGPLIRELVTKGITVYALAPDFDDLSRKKLRDLGAHSIDCSMTRTGLNPFRDFLDLWKLKKQLKQLRIDTTFAYFIKPVIYGTLAAKLAGIPNRYAMIEGAGYVFTAQTNSSCTRLLLKFLVILLYKLSLSQVTRLFLLNLDDQELFVKTGMVDGRKVVLLPGIGVDLKYFEFSPPVTEPFCFIMIARLLKEKGIFDYVEAARLVKLVHPEIHFLLLGDIDINPSAIPQTVIGSWSKAKNVDFRGHVRDVRPWLAQSSVFVLPSYREGLPRSTQEALAMGRPIITTDAVGCRDTVEEGINGFKVPIRNPAALAKTMLLFIENLTLVSRMGTASRIIAENKFDSLTINTKIITEMGII